MPRPSHLRLRVDHQLGFAVSGIAGHSPASGSMRSATKGLTPPQLRWESQGLGSASIALLTQGMASEPEAAIPSGAVQVPLPEDWVEVPLELIVNGEPQGEQVLILDSAGRWLMLEESLSGLGVQVEGGERVKVREQPHVVLDSLPDTRVAFDEKSLQLALSFPPRAFPPQQRSLSTRPDPRMTAGAELSGLLNYRLGHFWGDVEEETALATELAVRSGPWLFAHDHLHTLSDAGSDSLRFHSQWVHDQRAAMRRLIVGDTFASSGELGSTLNLGGISFRKAYQLSPYFVHQPTASIRGAANLPSDVRVFIGENQVFGQRLAPGPFELRDFNYYGGRQDVRVVVRDAVGRETVYRYPFYFTDLALAAGLHDYSYSAGWLRRNFGVSSNNYGPFAASAYHRYGVNEHVTLGLRGEWLEDRGNWGPLVTLRSDDWGVVTAALAQGQSGSSTEDHAWSAGYWYQYQGLNVRAAVREQGGRYPQATEQSLLASLLRLAPLRRERMAGIGYGSRSAGSFDVQYLEQDAEGEPAQRRLGFHYARSLWARVSLFASLRRSVHGAPQTELFAGFAFSPSIGVSVSAFHSQYQQGESDVLQYSDLPGVGEGFGYRLGVEQNRSAQLDTTRLSPYAEYNTRYGKVLAEDYAQITEDGKFFDVRQVAAEGALAWVGGHWAATRRVHDSFALARLSEPVEGVRVYHNGQLIGRTDAQGLLPIPHLGAFFANPVGIEHKDVPIEYNVASLQQVVSPAFRGGALVEFQLDAPRRLAGQLWYRRIDGSTVPVEYHPVTLSLEAQPLSFATGGEGGFYLEDLQPGRYPGVVELAGQACRFELEVPAQRAVVVELKEPVYCEIRR